MPRILGLSFPKLWQFEDLLLNWKSFSLSDNPFQLHIFTFVVISSVQRYQVPSLRQIQFVKALASSVIWFRVDLRKSAGTWWIFISIAGVSHHISQNRLCVLLEDMPRPLPSIFSTILKMFPRSTEIEGWHLAFVCASSWSLSQQSKWGWALDHCNRTATYVVSSSVSLTHTSSF